MCCTRLARPEENTTATALIALRDRLRRDFRCVYVNVEAGQAHREDLGGAMRSILDELGARALRLGDGLLDEIWPEVLAKSGPGRALGAVLTRWCLADPKPLVLLIDEIDSLVGDTLLSVLRQLRAGYEQRREAFPQSVVLCGVRDIRDYRIRSSSGEVIAGGSPFNIAARSLRLGDFSEAETRSLLAQHTEETGQPFTEEALETVWTQTRGQPWLVNALAADVCFESEAGRDRTRPVTAGDIMDARERLIPSRRTHLDQLAHKLGEARVRRVIEPLLSGGDEPRYHLSDLDYVRDLGLVGLDSPPRIANPIYAEVVPRELGQVLEDSLDQETGWYVDAGGGLELDRLLAAFQVFFREHSEHWLGRFEYREAGPQLILQAFLQRVVNGGGRIEREYGLGRGRTDLLILWPRGERRRFVVECKVFHEGKRRSLDGVIGRGVEQTLGYLDRCGSGEGHLVVFDRKRREAVGGEGVPPRGAPERAKDRDLGDVVRGWGAAATSTGPGKAPAGRSEGVSKKLRLRPGRESGLPCGRGRRRGKPPGASRARARRATHPASSPSGPRAAPGRSGPSGSRRTPTAPRGTGRPLRTGAPPAMLNGPVASLSMARRLARTTSPTYT